jgi:hypothetical protein
VRLVASLHAGTGDTQVVDVRNDGALPGLPDDAVVEVPCTVGRDGAHPLPQRALPPEMSGLVAHCKAYERLAVEAALSGSRDTMIRALVANPLVGQYPKAEKLADTLAYRPIALPPPVLSRHALRLRPSRVPPGRNFFGPLASGFALSATRRAPPVTSLARATGTCQHRCSLGGHPCDPGARQSSVGAVGPGRG